MSSVQIKDKTENTAPVGDEWLFAQDPADPFTVKKMSVNTIGDYITDYAGFTPEVVGASIKTYLKLIPISASFPWFCLSYPDVDLTTTNYSTEFIDELRARKYIYDEFSTNTSTFSGTWSSNVFTLTDNAANNAMLAELAEDWLYHGSPTSNWRILRSNNQDYNITGITVATRQITVNIDGSATSGTSIEIFTNRVYRQATQARHFSEAGLATYQAGGGKSGRLFRRDQTQGHWHTVIGHLSSTSVNGLSPFVCTVNNNANIPNTHPANMYGRNIVTDGTNGTPRTGSETIAKSSSDYRYVYVGSYTV